MEKLERPAAGSMPEKHEDPTTSQDFMYECIHICSVCRFETCQQCQSVHMGYSIMCVKPNHVNINIKTVLKFWFRVAWAHLEDNPEFKTGDTAKFRQHISKWADWTYSRKFGETIDAVDDNQGGDDLSRPHQRNGCEFATPMIFSPKKMSPIIVMMTIAMITMTMMIKSQRRLWSWGLTNVLDNIYVYSLRSPMPSYIWHVFL